jgi:hypothetical protein
MPNLETILVILGATAIVVLINLFKSYMGTIISFSLAVLFFIIGLIAGSWTQLGFTILAIVALMAAFFGTIISMVVKHFIKE